MRRAFPTFREGLYRISEIRGSKFSLNVPVDLPAIGVLLRTVLPGWLHIYCGYKNIGKFILGVYVVLALMFALFVGTPLGALVMGTALALHVVTVMHLLMSDVVGWRNRFCHAFVVYGVFSLLYVVGWWAIQRVVNPITLVQTIGDFKRGDVAFMSQWFAPKVGKIVYYQFPVRRAVARRQGGAVNYQFGANSFDRLLAHEGQSYSISNGKLIVDGVESTLRPASGEIPTDLKVAGTVPPGHWLILPGMVPNAYLVDPLNQIAIVSNSNVDGVLFLRRKSLFSWESL
ncbi:hypothetical protein [Planctomicrobium sp. SH527]|uniref:hypothetical protein n=1 Tax=Planctomicrobium sp. SH527 TaxID=3448123 RepID=UPI003F5BAA46